MRYLLRVVIPDRPGALGAVASRLGEAGVDIVSLDVMDRSDGVAVDDVRVETDVRVDRLRSLFEQVPGVLVEAVDEVHAPADDATPTSLAARIAECRTSPLQCLVDGLPAALGASWATAVADGPSGLEVLAASDVAPAVPAGLRLPFLPLKGTRRLPPAQWMPDDWITPAGTRAEAAVARLDAPYSVVLLARPGPRFRAGELRRLEELARVAVASADLPVLAGSTPS